MNEASVRTCVIIHMYMYMYMCRYVCMRALRSRSAGEGEESEEDEDDYESRTAKRGGPPSTNRASFRRGWGGSPPLIFSP